MLGLFGIFGRSRDLQRLDQALRTHGLHPRLMPDAAKLTAFKLLREATGQQSPPPQAHAEAAALLTYCLLGAQGFAQENGLPATEAVERRIEVALEAGDSLDAQLVLLTLHAGLVQPTVVDRYGLEAG